jgi:transaldolase
MMSAQQCLLAAMAGATYVSLFGGRVANMGYNPCEEITRLRKVLDNFNLKAKIIIGSTREVLNIIEWLGAGAHFVTVVPNLLEGMIVHPYSKETVRQFLNDAAKIETQMEVEHLFPTEKRNGNKAGVIITPSKEKLVIREHKAQV